MQGLPHGFMCLLSLQQLLPRKSHLRRPFKCIFSSFYLTVRRSWPHVHTPSSLDSIPPHFGDLYSRLCPQQCKGKVRTGSNQMSIPVLEKGEL